MEEKIKAAMMKDKDGRLGMSRVPKRIRDNFITLAEQEFEGDYGMTLKYLWDKYEDSVLLFNNFDIKLDYIIELSKMEDTTKSDIVKTMSGRIVKGG